MQEALGQALAMCKPSAWQAEGAPWRDARREAEAALEARPASLVGRNHTS